ncbi:MAG: chromosomal replication initiator protein DnaA [Vampirovibrionales bacterium]|nr:chromosomal replication initiator protein DnaA [Vampirovibrionales bacterium]
MSVSRLMTLLFSSSEASEFEGDPLGAASGGSDALLASGTGYEGQPLFNALASGLPAFEEALPERAIVPDFYAPAADSFEPSAQAHTHAHNNAMQGQPDASAQARQYRDETSLKALWLEVLTQVQHELSAPSFETWVRPLALLDVMPDAQAAAADVTLAVPNVFHRDWVIKNYKPVMLAAFRKVTGLVCQIAFEIAPQQCDTQLTLSIQASSPHSVQATSPELFPAPRAADAPYGLAGLDFAEPEDYVYPASSSAQRATHAAYTSMGQLPRAIAHDQHAAASLNPRYTFEQFVVGQQNRFAHAACMAVAENPGTSYNPLFLYGGVGLGKTHLVQAVGHAVLQAQTSGHVKQVRYVTAEQFTNELIDALAKRAMNAFRNRYRKVDVLIVDDVQFLEGKERTQEEMFHTFNALHQAGKQVILTSDGHPKRLECLEERLRSRFEWGLIADIQPLDVETRIAILQKKSQRDGLFTRLKFSSESLLAVAERFPNNIRELEGALNKVAAYAMLHTAPEASASGSVQITAQMTHAALGKTLDPNRLSSETVIQTVARYYHLQANDIIGPCRLKDVAYARQVCVYLLRSALGASFHKIGQALGARKHTTALYAFEKFRDLLEQQPALRKQLDEIQHQLPH